MPNIPLTLTLPLHSPKHQVIIIDGKGHLVGRLASTVAKMALSGQRVVVVRCEELNISGPHMRNKLRLQTFMKKRCLVNPKKGPFHHRAPSRIFYRAVRGMVPHRTTRGKNAMASIKVFEGIPAPYDTMKRMVVPQALRVLRLGPGRKFTHVGKLASELGWNQTDILRQVEAERISGSAERYEERKTKADARAKVIKENASKVSEIDQQLKTLGY
ncbi:60S ribosomal protein L16A [Tieghemiomyces parasiticus]|uniref:60S ribosomal protein L16A n=1 Tax=Tieghemiomyces parasiticus TaxID=78921 RepID=A0A9W8ABX4_9FUNG|nr:60S ribosomal protein L16A [Tieghemiomyces parasiticus]